MSRQARKLEHLWHAVRSEPASADFSDIGLVHNCLPGTCFNTLDLSTRVAGIPLKSPIFINAITGGVEDAEEVNRELALAARECGLAFAVGSQMAALEDMLYERTFKVVRQVYPEGVIFANIGAYADTEMARRAVDMLEADALQVHLNVPQELMMAEGDSDFRSYRERLLDIVLTSEVPVIVKEVGFGVAREQAVIFQEMGVAAIDVGGRGGTNFLQIEKRRAHLKTGEGLLEWGIPTAATLLETAAGAPELDLIASGGVNTGMLVAKSLALGARAAGLAGLAVKILLSEGREALVKRLQNIEWELKTVMCMTGAASIAQLRTVPVAVTGRTREWLTARGIPI
jgi:isopentenyl-diphosphate delta-isomerase